jgi:peptide/nickel transport system permease protein
MKTFLLKRLGISVMIFFALTFFVFMLSNLAPGSPMQQYITPDFSDADIARMEEYLGLNKPLVTQYFSWLQRMLLGDLGNSYRTKSPVIGLIGDGLGPTAVLAACSLVVSLIFAFPLGILAACKPDSVWDHISSAIAYVGTAVPRFFVGLTVVYIFAVKLKLLPTSGLHASSGAAGLGDRVIHLILPVFVVSFGLVGIFIKQIRSSMLETMSEEYVKLARAKGLPEWRVITGFVLRNALIPVVTTIGFAIPGLLSGAVVSEQLFSLPGIGKLLMQSVAARDYPVIMGVAMFISVVVLVVNLLLDIIYGLLDPRIRLAKS